MNANSLKQALSLVGIIIFFIVLSQINRSYIWQILLSVKLSILLVAVLVQTITLIFKSERWRVLISLYQDFPFFHVFRASMYGCLYAAVTPARLGVGFAAPFIKSSKINYTQIFFSIIIDRVLDIITIVFAGYIGLILLRNIIGINAKALFAFTLGLILLLVFLFLVLKTKSKTALSFIRGWEKAEGIKKWFSDIFKTIENNY